MRQLFKGRIDLWAVADMTGAYMLRKHFPEQVQFIKRAEGPTTCCTKIQIGISRQFQPGVRLLAVLQQGYQQLLVDGWAKKKAEEFHGENNVPSHFLPRPEQLKSPLLLIKPLVELSTP